MKLAAGHNLSKLPPTRRSSRKAGTEGANLQSEMSKDERRNVMSTAGSRLTPYMDDEDRRLADAWGVAIGSNAWVELITRYCISTQIRHNFAAVKMVTPEPDGILEHARRLIPVDGDQQIRVVRASNKSAVGASSTPTTPRLTPNPMDDFSPLSSLENTPRLLIKFTGLKRLEAKSDGSQATTVQSSKRLKMNSPVAPNILSNSTSSSPCTQSTSTTLRPLLPASASTTSSASSSSTAGGPKPYMCREPTCKFHIKGFKRREHLRRHVTSVHNKTVVATCTKCGAGFTRVDNAKAHQKTCPG